MNLLVTLDVALGLIVVYLVFALAVTAFNEGIAAALSSRARWLRKGIEQLLSDDGTVDEAGKDDKTGKDDKIVTARVDSFYKSPFVAYLGQGGLWQGDKPSYIPPWAIVQGLLSSVSTAKTQTFDTIDKIKTAIAGLPETPIKAALNDLVLQAGTEVNQFRSLVEAWFKTFDAQVIAWYRQKTHYVVLALSVLVVGALNVDTVAIVRQLSSDPKTREMTAQVALDMLKTGQANELADRTARDQAKKTLDAATKQAEEAAKKLDIARKEPDAGRQAAAVAAAKATKEAADLAETKADAAWKEAQSQVEQHELERIKALEASGLKFGWATWPQGTSAWIAKFFGLMVSALAISLGAPFWFDALKNVAAIRSVGLNFTERDAKKDDKKDTRKEATKDDK